MASQTRFSDLVRMLRRLPTVEPLLSRPPFPADKVPVATWDDRDVGLRDLSVNHIVAFFGQLEFALYHTDGIYDQIRRKICAGVGWAGLSATDSSHDH